MHNGEGRASSLESSFTFGDVIIHHFAHDKKLSFAGVRLAAGTWKVLLFWNFTVKTSEITLKTWASLMQRLWKSSRLSTFELSSRKGALTPRATSLHWWSAFWKRSRVNHRPKKEKQMKEASITPRLRSKKKQQKRRALRTSHSRMELWMEITRPKTRQKFCETMRPFLLKQTTRSRTWKLRNRDLLKLP